MVKVINTLKKYNFINVFFAPLPWIQLGLAGSQVYASIPRVYLNLIEEDEESTDAAPLNIGEPTGVSILVEVVRLYLFLNRIQNHPLPQV